MVKYIVHNTGPIGSDVDEIIIGDGTANDIDPNKIKYKKYVSMLNSRGSYVYTDGYPRSEFPGLRIIQLYDYHAIGCLTFGNNDDRKYFKYHLFSGKLPNNMFKLVELPYIYMISLDLYKKYVDSYPKFCSKALEEHEKEYFDKTVFMSFAEYNLSFIYGFD